MRNVIGSFYKYGFAVKFKVKRGTNLSNAGTPEAGELIYKSDTNELFVGNGSTAATGLTAIGGAGTSGSNNQLLTDDGSGGINSESSLTFDGTQLIVSGSGSTVLDIQGSQGQLFSVTDDLLQTVFSVGVPSSSIVRLPLLLSIVPSSTIVTPSLATLWPTRS